MISRTIILLLLSAVCLRGASDPYDYRILATNKTSTMEKELNNRALLLQTPRDEQDIHYAEGTSGSRAGWIQVRRLDRRENSIWRQGNPVDFAKGNCHEFTKRS